MKRETQISAGTGNGQRVRCLPWGAWLVGLVCLCFWFTWVRTAGAEETPVVAEHQVKAVYVYNFTKFTDWPESAFATSNAPIVIGVLGEDPIGQTLDGLVRGESVRGRPLVVKRLRPADDIRGCHVLFICRDEKDHLATLLQTIKGAPVLTVSDAAGFAGLGGMVNFVVVQETVKLEINQASAEEAGLKISAKLLKLARIVNPNPTNP